MLKNKVRVKRISNDYHQKRTVEVKICMILVEVNMNDSKFSKLQFESPMQ